MYTRFPAIGADYSQTCIKRPCIKRSPSIKRSVVKVKKIYPLNYSKCDLF